MKKQTAFKAVVLMLAASFLWTACSTTRQKSSQIDATESQEPMHIQNNKFAFDIFKATQHEHDDNLVISPFSISTAMAMTYAGARSETADQMSETLHFDANQDNFHPRFHQWVSQIREKGEKKEQLKIANSLWPQEDFHFVPAYFDLIEAFYQSALYEVDYTGDRAAIRQEINQWVEKHTNDLIKDLIKPNMLVEDTRLVLVNAIYFLSQWKIAFDQERTHTDRFQTAENQWQETSFMYMKDTLNYYETNEYQVLELPYEGEDFSMVVVLPGEESSLDHLINGLNAPAFDEMSSSLAKNAVEVFLPSFKVRSNFELEKLMAQMGMPLAFTNKADFSGMTQQDDLKIDKIVHEAFIDVKEEGTEAAASTAVIMIRKSAIVDEEQIVFKVNRPFFYAIKENTGNSILFMGKVTDPSIRDE